MSVALALPQPARWRYRLRRVLTEAGSVMLVMVLLIWSLAPVYNMFLIALDPEEGEIEFDGNLWPPEAVDRRLPRGHNAGGAVSRDFLAPVRQQLVHWFVDDGFDRADRVAGELRREPHAAEQGRAADQRRAPHLCDPRVLSDCPLLSDHAQLWAVG